MQRLIQLQKYFKLSVRVFVLAVFLLLPGFSKAVTGDTLFQCDFETGSLPSQAVLACGGLGSWALMDAWVTLESSGGAIDNGKYMKLHRPSGASASSGTFTLGHAPKAGVTYTWYEKFDRWPILGGNIKSIRPYVEDDNYYAAMIGVYCPGCSTTVSPYTNRIYISSWGTGSFGLSSLASIYPSVDCTGSNPYVCNARLMFNWSTDGGITEGFGVDRWHKFRLFTQTPSSPISNDGRIYLWIDEQLILFADNVSSGIAPGEVGGKLLDHVDFFPSDAAVGDYYHSMDKIVGYEGYVPPGGPDTAAPAAPSGLSVM